MNSITWALLCGSVFVCKICFASGRNQTEPFRVALTDRHARKERSPESDDLTNKQISPAHTSQIEKSGFRTPAVDFLFSVSFHSQTRAQLALSACIEMEAEVAYIFRKFRLRYETFFPVYQNEPVLSAHRRTADALTVFDNTELVA